MRPEADPTWKAQGFYRFNDIVRVRAAAGTGIKNPSQTELFGFNATGPFPFRGNPNLKPEKSRGYEGGVDLSFWDGRVSLGATYFHAKLRDEIFSYFGGPGLPGLPSVPGTRPLASAASRATSTSSFSRDSRAISPTFSSLRKMLSSSSRAMPLQ